MLVKQSLHIQTILTRTSAREAKSTPTSTSSDLLLITRILWFILLARKTFFISFTIGKYDSHAVTIPLDDDESSSPIALAAIIDSKPVPDLHKSYQFIAQEQTSHIYSDEIILYLK